MAASTALAACVDEGPSLLPFMRAAFAPIPLVGSGLLIVMLGVAGRIEGHRRLVVASVVINAGFGPDTSFVSELQLHLDWATRAPMGLASAIRAAQGEPPAPTVRLLEHPEPDFWILGAKSHGRMNTFTLAHGYAQVAAVLA